MDFKESIYGVSAMRGRQEQRAAGKLNKPQSRPYSLAALARRFNPSLPIGFRPPCRHCDGLAEIRTDEGWIACDKCGGSWSLLSGTKTTLFGDMTDEEIQVAMAHRNTAASKIIRQKKQRKAPPNNAHCPECGGTGKIGTQLCRLCKGK